MADPVLHIKDSYYFEVPKVLYPYELKRREDFPDVWISLDPEYQDWEAHRLLHELEPFNANLPPEKVVLADWHKFGHADHANFAKPLDVFLDEKYQHAITEFNAWKARQIAEVAKKGGSELENAKDLTFDDYLDSPEAAAAADADYLRFFDWRHTRATSFAQAKNEASNIEDWKADTSVPEWSEAKLAAYNGHLSGKILIPQPFGTLRNLYERESGFAISKFMILEILVGLIVCVVFAQLAKRIAHGKPPKGKLWNLLEVFLVFIRDQIARPTLGGHHEEDSGHDAKHGHEFGSPYAEQGEVHAAHGHGTHAHPRPESGHGHHPEPAAHGHTAAAHAAHHDPSAVFVPLLWTIFFFVLGCNLMGMVPWAGSPTAAWSVTLALAAITFGTVVVFGMFQFGFFGFFLNQIPGMDLPWYMAIVIKPMILAIELLGLLIKHLVLSIRLLANMVAGHLVILGIMGLAFGAEAALHFTSPETPGWQWWLTATIAVVGAAAFNLLELFVAFLQAYIFTFLSALFIGAAIHKH